MGRGMAFAELLDEMLGSHVTERPTTQAPQARHIPTINVFFAEFGGAGAAVCDRRAGHSYPRQSDPVAPTH